MFVARSTNHQSCVSEYIFILNHGCRLPVVVCKVTRLPVVVCRVPWLPVVICRVPWLPVVV